MLEANQLERIIENKAGIPGTWRHWRWLKPSFSDDYVFIIVNEGIFLYSVRIVVFDKPQRWGYGNLQVYKVSNHTSLSGAKSKASSIYDSLSSVYEPRLPILGFLNNKRIGGIENNHHEETHETIERATWEHSLNVSVNEADDYLRPFDIINKARTHYSHYAIYLGDGYICHFSGEKMGSSGSGSMKVEKDTLRNFLRGSSGSLGVIRPVVKEGDLGKGELVERIAKAIANEYGKGRYRVFGNNCQHFANAVVLGINHSQQGGCINPFRSSSSYEFVLKNEIEACHNHFNNLTSSSNYQSLVREIKHLTRERSDSAYGNWEARIEVKKTNIDSHWCKLQ